MRSGFFRTHIVAIAATLAVGLVGARAEETGQPAPKSQFDHGDWPFRPPVKPPVPSVQHQGWVANPIDAFVLSRLEAKHLQPNAPAEKLALLRRVTFDLTGLPPTVAEQDAFLADASPEAYAKVVDRLLASPHYGERFAQYWLDLVRYAESDGFNQDAIRENAHKFRDYVIQALNDDLPYDRFIEQQIAGDETEPDNPRAIIATGLNRLYPDEYNAADLRLRRQEILDDITDTTGLAFLGLTMGCAQCHDHKFDEILQADYYRLQAFFQPMLPRDDVVVATAGQQHEYEAKQARWEAATREIRVEIEAMLEPLRQAAIKNAVKKYDAELQEAILTPDAERTAYQRQMAAQARAYIDPKVRDVAKGLKGEQKERYERLTRELAKFDELKPAPLPRAMSITDARREAPPTYRLATGNFRKPLEPIDPGFPEFLGVSTARVEPPAKAPDSTGRRTALARWLARGDHPLTSRVMVNRVWQYHFSEGIVPSGNDFGAMGDPPSHPQLLDWLAVTFVEQGWSFKRLHRLIVTSQTYQQSSTVDADNPRHQAALEADPTNRLLWHFRRHRLEGEGVRDAMLLVSGDLNARMFGPSERPALPAGAGSDAWKADQQPENQNRRSIYVLAKRNLRYPLFDAFDLPDMHHSCARRSTTTTAPQALALLNSEFTIDRARHWAGRLLSDAPVDDHRLIVAAYREAYGRLPAEAEIELASDFLESQTKLVEGRTADPRSLALPLPLPSGLAPSRAAAVVDFCHALFNANEFLYVD